MIALPRRVLRLLFRAGLVIGFALLLVVATDTYLDFLPPAIQTRLGTLYPSDPVLVDIDVHTCMFGGRCPPDGRDGWTRMPKDLYLGSSWVSRGYVYTKGVPEAQLEQGQLVILDVAVDSVQGAVPEHVVDDVLANSNSVDSGNLEEVLEWSEKLGWKVRNAEYGLWLKFGKNTPGKSVTGLKVLFGHGARYPLPGWTLLEFPLRIGGGTDYDNSQVPAPRLAFRRGHAPPVKPSLKAKSGSQNTFKIVQLADLHMVTGYGHCESPANFAEKGCKADHETTAFVESVLDEENPDFIVFSGDQIFGSKSPDPETAMLKALSIAIEREIPYAVIFGNHDGQGTVDNSGLMELIEALPYSLATSGPENVTGVGNYVLNVPSSGKPQLTMYFLDSHTNHHHRGSTTYDYIDESQLDFVRDTHELQVSKYGEPSTSSPRAALTFFHIPLTEFSFSDRQRIGTMREGVAGPSHDEGVLETLRSVGVSILGVGHDHCNDYCQLESGDDNQYDPIWLCYGGASGFGGYGGYPDAKDNVYERRVRIYEVDLGAATVRSWKRVESHEEPIEELDLVLSGSANTDL